MWYKLDGDDLIKVSNEEVYSAEEIRRQNITEISIRGIKEPWIVVHVSTVFLRLDHGRGMWNNVDKPMVFESMVFVDKNELVLDKDEYLTQASNQQIQSRYSSITDARKGHETLVEYVRQELIKKKMGAVIRTDKLLSL